jgi:quercetin dioxygenase-like cupin family protein
MAKIYLKSEQQKVMSAPLAIKCLEAENIEIILISLKKGEQIPVHKNPFQVIFFVKSGKGVLTVENESFILEQNESAFVPTSENRSWENNECETLELFVIKFLNENF